jgi:ankyrin repeat protein
VDLLAKYGANVNLPFVGKDGEFTALYIAVSLDLQNMVRRLVGHGADVNWCGKKGITCLMRAAARGFVEMCGLLIDGGAQIDWESDIGINALFLAAILGKEDTFDVLLERGASGKPPKVCNGKWKNLEKFCKGRVSKEMKGRMLKKLRSARRQ